VLAKVPVKRIDRKSSFAALTNYILEQAAAVRFSEGVFSAETAGIEMERVARRNERVKDAAYHYILSWRSGEDPTDSQAFDAVSATLTALNMAEHQWIGAVHRNTQHVHTHVAVNRVHPATYKSVYPKGDWIVLDQACRRLEIRNGWDHSPGPHVVEVGTDHAWNVVRMRRDRSEVAKPSPTSKARNFAAWNGVESFQEWVGKTPADSLKRALEKRDANWHDVHETLKSFNLEYRPKGSGAVVVDCSVPGKLCAKASHVGRFASFGQLVTQLGPYEHRREHSSLPHEPKQFQPVKFETSYRGVSQKRDQRQEQSRVTRDDLFKKYAAAKLEWVATEGRATQQVWSRQRASEETRIEALREENRAARKRIKALPTPDNKRVLYSVQAFAAAPKREKLQHGFREERRELKASQKHLNVRTFCEWLSRQATAGDKSAVEALRRIRYRDQAERRSHGPRIEIGSITGADAPRNTVLEGLNWVADARGVDFRINDKVMFRDEGRRVVFRDLSDDAIRAGLLLCREKWARGLCLSGTEEFRAKVGLIAATMHIRIVDPMVKHPVPDLDVAKIRPALTVSSDDSTAFANVLDRLVAAHRKPIVFAEARLGRRHTGKIIALENDVGVAGIVVIDVGRELAILRTSAETVGRLKTDVGRWISARAVSIPSESKTLVWRFVDPRGLDTALERSP
jgi:hypothetical protein